jgi:uroporphyrinogen decarboxylase
MDYRATPEATEMLLRHLGCDSLSQAYERLHIDRVLAVGPRYVGPPLVENWDVYGCCFMKMEYATGTYRECIFHPLADYESVEEIDAEYEWPSPDWYDYSHIPEQVSAAEDRLVSGGGSEPFLTYKHMRGQEQAFIDLVENPEIVHYCLDRLFDLCHEKTRRIYETVPGKVAMTSVSEDLGAQTTLMYSPDQIRTFLLPRMKRMMDLAHQAGAFVIHHSDGAIRPVLPDLIQAGIDILDPVQWRCTGMDREALKRDFGDRLVFHGAMDNQYTLAFGSVDEVRQEVLDNLRILGEKGGFVLGPCHNIQSISPPENVVAMYEEGYENGWT